jgi:RNA polymerase sigma-70 factor (ECF subfamily)
MDTQVGAAKSRTLDANQSAERAIREHSAMIYRAAYSLVQNRPDAEDVMQDVIVKYLTKRPTFESAQHEKAWLLRVTINQAKSLLSSYTRKQVSSLDTEDFPGPTSVDSYPADSYQGDARLMSAVAALPTKQRICIHLFYFEDYSVTEIASLTDFKQPTIKSHLSRARKALKSKLEGIYDEL